MGSSIASVYWIEVRLQRSIMINPWPEWAPYDVISRSEIAKMHILICFYITFVSSQCHNVRIMASQISSQSTVYWTLYSDAHYRWFPLTQKATNAESTSMSWRYHNLIHGLYSLSGRTSHRKISWSVGSREIRVETFLSAPTCDRHLASSTVCSICTISVSCLSNHRDNKSRRSQAHSPLLFT